ncbi:MAG TPA: hypothetical protein VK400_06750 [Pyrinomonadaceae bacterium]|nr:hypothetical protein [Pyrinomonadaceae bacterium]
MNSDSEETLRPDEATNKILEAIGGLHREMNERFVKTEARLTNIEARLTNIEGELKDMKDLQRSFAMRLDRHEAMLLNMRADMKILRAEVEGWALDVLDLQRKVA